MKSLGQKNSYLNNKTDIELDRIHRSNQRENLLLNWSSILGFDLWHSYEVSFLIKDVVHNYVGQFRVPSNSEYIFESKSLKLFLNSMNNKDFSKKNEALDFISLNLSECCNTRVEVSLFEIEEFNKKFPIGCKLQRVKLTSYTKNISSKELILSDEIVREVLYTDLFRSNCLVTNQPDWGTITIDYSGNKINHELLHGYLMSFRNHNAFHEHCVDMIYDHIHTYANPSSLTIYGNFLRRGGIDITPIRTNNKSEIIPWREVRQ